MLSNGNSFSTASQLAFKPDILEPPVFRFFLRSDQSR